MHHTTTTTKRPSVLASLRALTPDQPVSFQDTLQIVEQQAETLLHCYGLDDGPTPDDIVSRFPRLKVVYTDDLPSSGASQWNGSQWVIFVRHTDCRTRRRFTMAHELAHIVHHGYGDRLFTGRHWLLGTERATDAACQRERAADHFAGCLLMPRTSVFALWARGGRTPAEVAAHFDVSEAAATVRLEQLGLLRPRWMCTRGLTNLDTARASVRPVFARRPA
ncbi:MAG: ImmA/IrrE family metallo-endopeptidase [Micrococcales bacterium]|nr:ImmA/IrrE family metallo-endopeptidase [Micrococcales bacterium]